MPFHQLSIFKSTLKLFLHSRTVSSPCKRVEFPHFGSEAENDPVYYVERCEEYLAIRPLSDSEILAALTSVLKGTVKEQRK